MHNTTIHRKKRKIQANARDNICNAINTEKEKYGN